MGIFSPEQRCTIPCKCGASIDIELTLSDLITGELKNLLEECDWGKTGYQRCGGTMLYEFSCPTCVENLKLDLMMFEEK